MGWGKGGEAGGGAGEGGEKRVVCGCYGNAQSLSYNYMGKNGSRTFTPRYTPTALSPGSALSLPSLSLPSRWQLRFFFCFHLAFFLRTPPRSSLPPHLLPHLPRRLLLLRLLLLIRLHLAVSSHRGTYFARLGNIMLAPYRGDCVTILNSL